MSWWWCEIPLGSTVENRVQAQDKSSDRPTVPRKTVGWGCSAIVVSKMGFWTVGFTQANGL